MAKVKGGPKSGLAKFNKFLLTVFCILLVATVLIVALSSPKVSVVEGGEEEFKDVATIEEFKADTYGGVEFASVDDVVNYYVECYNNTKTQLADYTENGEAKQFYALLGEEDLKVENLLVEGKANATIDKLVPGILSSVFNGGVKSLAPSNGIAPEWDKQEVEGQEPIDRTVSHLTADDVLACNVADNGDGTITLQIQPKAALLSMPGQDSQGRFFNVLGDISGVVNDIGILKFETGTIQDNFVVNYAGGAGTIKIDTKTKTVVEADYVMNVHINVSHATVTVIKDKNASLDIVYTNHYPASEDYLAGKNIQRK